MNIISMGIKTNAIQEIYQGHYLVLLDFPTPHDLLKIIDNTYRYVWGVEHQVLGTEWKDYDFSFIPSKSGKVNISIGAQWAKTPAERQWVLVNKMELNDQLYKNGDFKATWKDKDGRVIPSGFWLWKGAKYLPTAGEKGTPAILVNHDNRLTCTLNVEAGKKYELEFE